MRQPAVNAMRPRSRLLLAIGAVAFVDDFAPYLRGVPAGMHKALILGGPEDSPNVGEDLALAHSTHSDLRDFARWWIDRPQG